ncbi:FAD-dependent oxidoreductase [Microbulbifer sp. OS29]|uniref:FAD-dependent oxidoreductase n=1 Tax=Microbulbifer okhotskensis TaxID=2926617 RepID=A0A9X2EML0_9GAMM|nr:FAD-dependent oxidoreductase [Microbulbifer okhotskensis]MCO1334997.1 FAD-dependent oxidoreductase [Microbulbifer okhotskensis]
MTKKYDVIIVGGGMAGLSSAFALRNSVDSILVCDQYVVGNAFGSSSGSTRMFREMYSNPYYSRAAKISNVLWESQEQLYGKRLRVPHGLLFYGEDWGEETIEGSICAAKQVMQEQLTPFEELTAKEISARWPLRTKPSWQGLFEPAAGAVLAREALNFWETETVRCGHEIRTKVKVISVCDGTDVEITFENGVKVLSKRCILAAGPWSRYFLKLLGYQVQLQIWQMLWAYYSVETNRLESYPQWFCFQEKLKGDPDQGLYYGFPYMGDRKSDRGLIKIGIDWAPEKLKLQDYSPLTNIKIPRELLETLDNFVFTYIDGVKSRVETHLCPYTMSPDAGFVLDRLSNNISIFSHDSGQAFKFAPVIGENLKRLVLDEPLLFDLSPWSVNRSSLLI